MSNVDFKITRKPRIKREKTQKELRQEARNMKAKGRSFDEGEE